MEMKTRVIAWWSGGIASALACYWAVQTFKNVAIVFFDTRNEDDDTYRFMRDCETLYGQKIEIYTNERYSSIEQIWYDNLTLNTATGAKCSSELKFVMANVS